MSTPVIDPISRGLFTGDSPVAPEFWEPLESYREFMRYRFAPTDFLETEIAALKQYLATFECNLDDASFDWQVAMAVCLARYHRRKQEETEHPVLVAEQVATRVAEWYCRRQGSTLHPRRRFKQICSQLRELTAATDAAIDLSGFN